MNSRIEKIAKAEPREAAKLVYQWVKTGVITFKEFGILLHFIDHQGCQDCGGEKGVPGNENIVDGAILCDYCHADRLRYDK